MAEDQTDELLDALVVGAGPTGLACAIEIGRRGLKARVIEKGCLVNSLYHYPTNLVFFTTPELLEIGDIPMTSVRDKPTRTEALKYYRRVTSHYSVDVRQYESVESIDGNDGDFRIATRRTGGRKSIHRAKKVILATGYYDVPSKMGIPGEDLDKVLHYYEDPHPFFDQDVLVIGGRNSAAIYALECHRAGARVRLVHRGEKMSDKIKYWILPDINNRIKSDEIRGYFQSEVTAIERDTVTVRTPGGEKTFANDWVLAMTGYQPDLAFLSKTGIELDPETERPDVDAETLESARPGLYLAGVVVAGMHTSEIFIENGRFHGGKIAEDLARKLG